jgi:hypothetical protein
MTTCPNPRYTVNLAELGRQGGGFKKPFPEFLNHLGGAHRDRRNPVCRLTLVIFFAFAEEYAGIEMACLWVIDNSVLDAVRGVARRNCRPVNQWKIGSWENRVTMRVVRGSESPQESNIQVHSIIPWITCNYSIVIGGKTLDLRKGLMR